MLQIRIREILNELSRKRPVFHSENDFRHSLAWLIHEENPDIGVRLEKRVSRDIAEYLDILLNGSIALELKYKTDNFQINYEGENYYLTRHGAQDQGRYDYLKDVSRIESYVRQDSQNRKGYAIMVTNDHLYWGVRNKDTVDKEFNLEEGRTISGKLKWKENASPSTKNRREDAIELSGQYKLQWSIFHDFNKENGLFKILLIEI